MWPEGAGALDIAAGVVLAAALTTAVLQGRLEGVRVVAHDAIVYPLLTLVIAMLYATIVALAAQFGQELSPFEGGVIVGAVALAACSVWWSARSTAIETTPTTGCAGSPLKRRRRSR